MVSPFHLLSLNLRPGNLTRHIRQRTWVSRTPVHTRAKWGANGGGLREGTGGNVLKSSLAPPQSHCNSPTAIGRQAKLAGVRVHEQTQDDLRSESNPLSLLGMALSPMPAIRSA